MSEVERKTGRLQPPDGGWGWMIVLGTALPQAFLIPMLQNFTLIFKDRFTELGFTSTEITTVVSLNSSFGMILGLLCGPMLKKFGYRKMALVGITLHVIGILCMGVAKSYIEFIIFYGLLSSLGMMKVLASFSLAINSYFLKKRSKAVSYSMTLGGLGPIIMPNVISYLLSSYGLKWTVFLMSGLGLHAYIGALLLQPVRWHMRKQNEDFQCEDKENKVLLSDAHSFLEMSVWGSRMSLPRHSVDLPPKLRMSHSRELQHMTSKEVKEELNKPRKLSVTFLDNDDYTNMMNSTLHMIEKMDAWERNVKCASAETLSLEYGECPNDFKKSLMDPLNLKSEGNECEALKVEVPASIENSKPGLLFRFTRFVKELFDIDLFRDPFYINIMLGLSVAYVGEIIFSTMTPVILKEIGFSTEETAMFMSIIAGCDLLCRFIAPFVQKKLSLNSKKMYLIALSILLISRAGVYLTWTYNACLLVSCGLGIGKGFRSVFWILVLPDYVPLSKLVSASAFQNLINGLLILISGPLMGAIITLTNSYLSIIAVSNILTLTTILLWSGEIIYLKCKKNS